MSEFAWVRGGGKDLRFAEADATMVLFSGFNRFIDILRRNPHLPDLVDVLVVKPGRVGGGGDSSDSES